MTGTTLLVAIGIALIFALVMLGGLVRSASYKATPILTATEAGFFRKLVAAAGDGYVFPQVSMGALLSPRTEDRSKATTLRNRVSSKRVDFAIYTQDLKLVCVVELDDHTHQGREEADSWRDRQFKDAGIQTLRYAVKKSPSVQQLRDDFLAVVASDAQAKDAKAANKTATAPVPAPAPLMIRQGSKNGGGEE